MAGTVADLTIEEFREVNETSIEQKLIEIFGDPEEGLELKDAICQQLLRQRISIDKGERGEPLKDAVRRFDLE